MGVVVFLIGLKVQTYGQFVSHKQITIFIERDVHNNEQICIQIPSQLGNQWLCMSTIVECP